MKLKKLVMMALVALTMGVVADTWTDANGYTWTYSVSDGKAIIENDESSAIFPKPTGWQVLDGSCTGQRTGAKLTVQEFSISPPILL